MELYQSTEQMDRLAHHTYPLYATIPLSFLGEKEHTVECIILKFLFQ